MDAQSTTDLILDVDRKVERVRTRSLDISFNELVSMHGSSELVIDPEYQRLFRWSEAKQSQFIESMILELPVPPVYVIESDTGVYELIDGLQRVSSYLHFRGAHPARRNPDGTFRSLTLTDCDILPELNGRTWNELPTTVQVKLKRHFIRVEVLRRESDKRLRYYMFKRLNTGGEILSPQEVRNCTIRLLDNKFNKFITEVSAHVAYQTCMSMLSEERKEKLYLQEYVLRFFAFKNWRDHYAHEVGDFLTEYMESVSDPDVALPFDYVKEEQIFKKTFEVLAASLGDRAFAVAAPKSGNLSANFSSYHFEAITLGLQAIIDDVKPHDATQMSELRSALTSIKQDDEFRRITTGGGKNYPGPLKERIEFVIQGLAATPWT